MDRSLAKIDLNLLRALHLLLEERSVTRAAHRLFISQPAMSMSLQRLRVLLDDPLFVRSPLGLLPTPRAEELAAPLRAVFEQMEHYLTPSRFDPASVRGLVRIAAPEQFGMEVIPRLLKVVSDKAPNLSIKSLHLIDEHLDLLAAGTLDFAVNLDRPYPEQFIAHPLSSSALRIWLRQEHPLAKRKKIELAHIFAYPLITFETKNFTAQDFRATEKCLAEAGLSLKVLLDTSHLLIALETLVKTDAVMFAPDFLSCLSVYNNEIVQRAINHIPVFDHSRIKLSLVQHSRTSNSQLHRWIVSEMCDEFARSSNKKQRARTTA